MKTWLLSFVCMLATVPLFGHAALSNADRKAALDEAQMLVLPRARALPDLALTDLEGRHFSTKDLKDHWSLLFFGFTYCPDVCPTTLSDMRILFAELDPSIRERLRLIFVTADPARDTPERMKSYLNYFDPAFIGLTGQMEDLQALSKAAGLPFVLPDTQHEGYSVTHSANMALIGPDGTLRGLLRAPFNRDALKKWIPALLASDQ
jgi:protein SCO1/2